MTRRLWLLALGVALFALLSQVNILNNGLVYDDENQVLRNPWITDVRHLPAIFTQHVWGFADIGRTNYYRPLMHVAYLLVFHAVGFDAWGYHLLSALLHLGVTLLVFRTARLLTAKQHDGWAALGALVFAAHPVHAEAVAWAAGIPDLLVSFWVLLALQFYHRAQSLRTWSFGLALACFGAAALSKEIALMVPASFILWDVHVARRPAGDVFKRMIPFALVCLAYLVVRVAVLGALAPHELLRELGPMDKMLSVLLLTAKHLQMLVVPHPLSLIHVLPAPSILPVLLALIVVAAYVAALVLTRRKDPSAFVSLSWVGIFLLPVLYAPVLGDYPFAERYLYLPSVGLSLLATLMGMRFGRMAVLPAGVIVLLFASGTIVRNAVWKDNETLWMDAVDKAPTSHLANSKVAAIHRKAGNHALALRHLEAAAADRPRYPELQFNIGNVHASEERWLEAAAAYQRALQLNPRLAAAHNNLGLAYRQLGREEEAQRHLAEAARLQPTTSPWRSVSGD